MTGTVKLYDDAPYEKEFTAVVLDVKEDEDGCVLVILDRTLFFPEEGGQSSDTGILSGFEVLHASIKEGVITHRVRCALSDIGTGDEVTGHIDWEHRFSNMQNHTGEHILSGLLHDMFHSENKGFHLSDNIVTLDTSKELDGNMLVMLESRANEVIYKDIPVECRYYAPEELKGKEYRSKIELKEDIRLVTIPGVDVCACCAPHVSRTGEIGIIKILRAIRYKGGMRLTILAGRRAYEHLSHLQDITDELSHVLSESTDKLKDAVERLLRENGEYRLRIKNEAGRRLEEAAYAIPADSHDAVIFTEAVDNTVQRNAVNMLVRDHKGICAVFASDDAGGYNFILSHPGQDARIISGLLKEKLSARGGGSGEMVQGNVKASREDILRVLNITLA